MCVGGGGKGGRLSGGEPGGRRTHRWPCTAHCDKAPGGSLHACVCCRRRLKGGLATRCSKGSMTRRVHHQCERCGRWAPLAASPAPPQCPPPQQRARIRHGLPAAHALPASMPLNASDWYTLLRASLPSAVFPAGAGGWRAAGGARQGARGGHGAQDAAGGARGRPAGQQG